MNFLTRLRGLQAPVALDEPFRLADSGSALPATGGAGGSPIIIVRNMREARRYPPPPPGAGGALTATGVTPGSYSNTNLTVGADGRLTAASNGSGGTTPVPASIPDLTMWWASDDILGAGGQIITRLRERTPWITGVIGANGTTTIAIDSTHLNSLNVLKWPSSPSASTTIPIAGTFSFVTAGTFFAVIKPASSTGAQAIIGAVANGLSLYQNGTTGVPNFSLVKSGAAIIGSSTSAWSAGTWYQLNVTYTASSGAYAFRQARATAGSGTGATGAGTAAITSWIGADLSASGQLLVSSSIAELIVYQRALSGTEITNVENYLFAKWGV